MRLGHPYYTPLAPGSLGLGHYLLKQYPRALAPLRECAARARNLGLGHLCLAAAYAQLGKLHEARAQGRAAGKIICVTDPNGSNMHCVLLVVFQTSHPSRYAR